MWYYLLESPLVGVFSEPELIRRWPVPLAETGVYHQLEWFCLLQLSLKDPAMRTAGQSGFAALLANRDIVRSQWDKLPVALAHQYEVMMTEAASLAALIDKEGS